MGETSGDKKSRGRTRDNWHDGFEVDMVKVQTNSPPSAFSKTEMMSLLRFCFIGLLLALPGFLFAAEEPAQQPNILFAIADDWSHGHSSVDGCPWISTPGFDRVAKDGLRFTNAFTPNAKCCPSRSILLTGLYSWQLEDAANHICYFPSKFAIYPEVLADNGYFVGYTGKGWGPGTALDSQGKPRPMTGQNFGRQKQKPPARGISNNNYAGNFEDFLKAAPKGQPWCFWYGATEPHRGYQYGIGVAQGKKTDDIQHVPQFWPDNETIRNDMLDYAVEVEHFDTHLTRMLMALEKQGLLENTLVVVTSDHGMPFPRCKGQAYNYSNHVPLAMMWPNRIKKPGRVIDDYVSFIDIAPTFLEAAGVDAKTARMQINGGAVAQGKSLLPVFDSEASGQNVLPGREFVLIGKERHDIGRPHDWGYPIRGIIKDGMLYIKNYETNRWPGGNPETGYLNCDGSPTKTVILDGRTKPDQKTYWQLCFGKRSVEELYSLSRDPDCVNNLAENPDFANIKQRLAALMEKSLKEQKDPRMEGKGHIFEEYIYSNPGTRNFYERYMKGEKLRAGWVNPSDFEEKPLD